MADKLFPLGAQLEGPLANRSRWLVPNRVYHFPIRWDECEISPGIYNLPHYAYENFMQMNNTLGLGNYQLIINIKCCPKFYAVDPTYRNSPVKVQYAKKFAKFINVIDQTFSPFGFEIWNEPEFALSESKSNQQYYGGYGLDGGLYGETMAEIFRILKAKGIQSKLISGASFGFVDIPRTLDFLRSAVNAGMQADYWSWHGYIWDYQVMDNIREFYKFLWFSDETSAIFSCPQILSETSVMRESKLPEHPLHRARQVELLEFLLRYKNNTCIESMLWYTLANNGWRHTDLVQNNIEQPVYQLWKHI